MLAGQGHTGPGKHPADACPVWLTDGACASRGVLLQQRHDAGLLGGRAPAADHGRALAGQLHKLELVVLQADLQGRPGHALAVSRANICGRGKSTAARKPRPPPSGQSACFLGPCPQLQPPAQRGFSGDIWTELTGMQRSRRGQLKACAGQSTVATQLSVWTDSVAVRGLHRGPARCQFLCD